MPLVSIIVPVYADEAALAELLASLEPRPQIEVIVSSSDADPAAVSSRARLAHRHPRVRWITAPHGRGEQLNAGAAVARGAWLLFLHADSSLPPRWLDEIVDADRHGAVGGWFRFALGSTAPAARVLERMVAWRVRLLALPYGDQGIFVRRDVFRRMGGYAPWPLMEDVEFVRRLAGEGPMHRASQRLVTSPRRWEQEGWLTRSARNLTLLALYGLGVSPGRLARMYERRR